jgi:hypothetical protein
MYERRIVTRHDGDPAYAAPVTTTDEVVDVAPSGGYLLARLVTLIFWIIQVLILVRIVLLLLDARQGNDIVQLILNASQPFVAPFMGLFNQNALQAGGSVLDIAAIAALVGWTILEAIILWVAALFRREPI